MTEALKSTEGRLVFRLEEPALDSSNRERVVAAIRSAAPPSAALILDWSNVVYVDFLGMEALFDCLLERTAPLVFTGVNRDIEHLFHRVQILAVLPTAPTLNDAFRLIGSSK